MISTSTPSSRPTTPPRWLRRWYSDAQQPRSPQLSERRSRCMPAISRNGGTLARLLSFRTLWERLARMLPACIWVYRQPRPSSICWWERPLPLHLPWSRLKTTCEKRATALLDRDSFWCRREPRASTITRLAVWRRPGAAWHRASAWALDATPWTQASWFLTGDSRLGDVRPIDVLRRGEAERVERAAAAYGDQGAA